MHVGSRDRAGAEASWKSYHQSTVDAPFVTPIFGLHMSRFFPKTDIEKLVKKAEKRTTLKGSILKTANFSVSKKNAILFQEDRKSFRSYLEFYSLL